MGLIQKKDEKDEIDGIQIIERGEGPDGDEEEKIDLVAGTSAEHIAAGTTAEEEDARLEAQIAADAADENLMPEEQDEDDDSDVDDHACKHKKTMIAAFVVAVVIAAVVGFFIGNGGFGGKGVGSATLTEDQLDSTVASYSYNGKKSDITAREAIESQYSLDTVKDGDGNYTAPSADVILSYVRNKILLDAAEDEGITVSSKEMKKYAEDSIGTSDYKTMATQYGVSKDQAKQIVRQSATLQKLYKKKVGDSSASMPTAPTEPADGNEETASKDYADYIIKLAGDEWDSEKGTWKDADSTYAKAFADDAKIGDWARGSGMKVTELPRTPGALVANLPYNVAVPVLLHMFAQFPSIEHALVMVQDEVADRLAAKPGSKIYGVPSVKANWFAEVSKAGVIGTNVFWPAPKIKSGLVAFERRAELLSDLPREEVFAIIDAAFAQRRKTLRAALSTWAGSGARAGSILEAAGIDPQLRGEKLDIHDFIKIAEAARTVPAVGEA